MGLLSRHLFITPYFHLTVTEDTNTQIFNEWWRIYFISTPFPYSRIINKASQPFLWNFMNFRESVVQIIWVFIVWVASSVFDFQLNIFRRLVFAMPLTHLLLLLYLRLLFDVSWKLLFCKIIDSLSVGWYPISSVVSSAIIAASMDYFFLILYTM